MILLWLVTGASLAAALLAWGKARQTGRRLEQLSEMYWELKYQHSELRLRVQRLSSGEAAAAASVTARPSTDTFVPLASLKR